MSKIITTWGAGGSGKTVTAVNLALAFAEQNYITGLISSNLLYGELQSMLGITIPEERSLPQAISKGTTKDCFVQIPANSHLYLMEIPNGIDALLTTNIAMAQVTELMDDAAMRFDVLVVDGSSDLNNPISGVALIRSDTILLTTQLSIKDTLWLKGMEKIIHLLGLRAKIKYLYNMTHSEQYVTGSADISAAIPYLPKMQKLINEATPALSLNSKAVHDYRAGIYAIDIF